MVRLNMPTYERESLYYIIKDIKEDRKKNYNS